MSEAISYQQPHLLERAAPRIDSLDLLRGIAILGIFLMNTWTMSLPQDAYTNPATYDPSWVPGSGFPVTGADGFVTYSKLKPLEGINHWVYVGIHLFADMKFITTFSILFGAGIVLQAERSRKKGNNPWLTHYLRMSVLLMFGLVHTFGFWYGDILTDYALAGLILAPCRLLPAWLLMIMGICLVGGTTGIEIADNVHARQQAEAPTRADYDALNEGWYKPLVIVREWETKLGYQGWKSFREHEYSYAAKSNLDPTTVDNENDRELLAYRSGWLGQFWGHRFWTSVEDHTTGFITWTFLRCGGCFLIGMSLQKRRFFHGAWPKEAYTAIASFAIPIGWIISYLGVLFNSRIGWVESEGYDLLTMWHLGGQFNYWGSLLCSIGYISFGVRLAIWAADPAKFILRKCVIPIRSIGRMAMTCYLTETLIGTTFYYGHGFGMFGYTTRAMNLPLVFGTWAFLMVFATLWLTYFRQGPFEWLWHSIAYWDWKNPRKSAAGPDASLSPSVAGSAGQAELAVGAVSDSNSSS